MLQRSLAVQLRTSHRISKKFRINLFLKKSLFVSSLLLFPHLPDLLFLLLSLDLFLLLPLRLQQLLGLLLTLLTLKTLLTMAVARVGFRRMLKTR